MGQQIGSSTATLVNFYDQSSPLIEKGGENLFLRLTKKGLELEERGFFSWVKRKIFRRQDTEYNLVNNLKKFQQLIEGSLVELQRKGTPDTLQKIKQLTLFYNSLLESKPKGKEETRLDLYKKRVRTGENLQQFTSKRVVEKIKESSADPTCNFIRANFTALIPQEKSQEDQIDLSIRLLSQGSQEHERVEKAYEKLSSRISCLLPFDTDNEEIRKAQQVLLKVPDEAKGVEGIIELLEKTYKSLAPVVESFFQKGLSEVEELGKDCSSLQKEIEEANKRVKTIDLPASLPELNVEPSLADIKKLIESNDEKILSQVGEKYKAICEQKTEAENKLKEFLTNLEPFEQRYQVEVNATRKLIGTTWMSIKKCENSGPTTPSIVKKYREKVQDLLKQLQESGLSAKEKIETEVSSLQTNFKNDVQAEIQRKQSETQKTIESLIGSYTPISWWRKVPLLRGDKDAALRAKAEFNYGVTKLIAETKRAIFWNRWMCRAAKKPPSESLNDVIVLRDKLERSTAAHGNCSPEDAKKLLEYFKKLEEKNSSLQTELETAEVPQKNFKSVQDFFLSLAMFQEEIDVLAPLGKGADYQTLREYRELQSYCRKKWNAVVELSPESAAESLGELADKRELLQRLSSLLWYPWCAKDPQNALSTDAFQNLNSQDKSQHITKILG